MANHAHHTRTPLLPPPGAVPRLLGQGLGRQSGAVTVAIAAMRAADPDAAPSLRAKVTRRAWELIRLDRLAGFAAAMTAAWHEARTVLPTPASTQTPPSIVEPLRALLVYDTLPAGCIAHTVTKDDLGPHLRPGEFAIIDPADRDPVRGELYLVARDSRALSETGPSGSPSSRPTSGSTNATASPSPRGGSARSATATRRTRRRVSSPNAAGIAWAGPTVPIASAYWSSRSAAASSACWLRPSRRRGASVWRQAYERPVRSPRLPSQPRLASTHRGRRDVHRGAVCGSRLR